MLIEDVLITGGSGFIGSYLIEELSKLGVKNIKNLDLKQAHSRDFDKYWIRIDILDKSKVLKAFQEFSPKYVVHLAARTDTDPTNTLDDYRANHEGTANVLNAVRKCQSVERVIITSTQFVNQYNGMPADDEDFAPHTIYGESKVIGEKLTRSAHLSCCWTIIRPTNIWGPRHPRYPNEFWYVLKKGRYIHPGWQPVIRSYGYVGNVVDQILRILISEQNEVNEKVFYVGDGPVNLYDWVNGFSLALNKKKVRVVPRTLVKALAILGEILRKFGLRFPITKSRYKSMTHSNSAPMDKTFAVLGQPKYSLDEGIKETVQWLEMQGGVWRS